MTFFMFVPMWFIILCLVIDAACEISLVTEEKTDWLYEAYKSWGAARSEDLDPDTRALLKQLAESRR
jgi:hypothetical protein